MGYENEAMCNSGRRNHQICSSCGQSAVSQPRVISAVFPGALLIKFQNLEFAQQFFDPGQFLCAAR